MIRSSDSWMRILPHQKFQRLHLVIVHPVQRFNIAANCILHGPHILDDDLRRNEFRINDTAQIQLSDDASCFLLELK